jgi:hypothetical protein
VENASHGEEIRIQPSSDLPPAMAGEAPVRNLSGTRGHSVEKLMHVRDLLGV